MTIGTYTRSAAARASDAFRRLQAHQRHYRHVVPGITRDTALTGMKFDAGAFVELSFETEQKQYMCVAQMQSVNCVGATRGADNTLENVTIEIVVNYGRCARMLVLTHGVWYSKPVGLFPAGMGGMASHELVLSMRVDASEYRALQNYHRRKRHHDGSVLSNCGDVGLTVKCISRARHDEIVRIIASADEQLYNN